jgi:hypothetical protein
MGGAYSRNEMRNAHEISAVKPKGTRPYGRHRHRWEDIIMDLMETVWEGMDWIHPPQDRDQWQALVRTQ